MVSCHMFRILNLLKLSLMPILSDGTKTYKKQTWSTANVNDLVLVNDDFFMTVIEHCCPLGKSIGLFT